jgi:hypothetical protein
MKFPIMLGVPVCPIIIEPWGMLKLFVGLVP